MGAKDTSSLVLNFLTLLGQSGHREIRKVYEKILAGTRDIRFDDLCRLAEGFGPGRDRVSGSHVIYRHPSGLKSNLQPERVHIRLLKRQPKYRILSRNSNSPRPRFAGVRKTC